MNPGGAPGCFTARRFQNLFRAMRYKNYTYIIICCLLGGLSVFFMQGCSKDENESPDKNSVAIPFNLNANQKDLLLSSSFDNSSHTVNRILILPFKKTSETATNDDINFVPDFTAAKQFDVSTFPTNATMLNLTQGISYKVMVIGYNRNDYNQSNPTATGSRFSIGSINNPIQLDNLHLNPTSPVSIPEFFSCVCNAQTNGSSLGAIFVAQDGIKLTGNLTRIISGLSLEVTNIPAFVDSVTLVAEQLVTAIKARDGVPTAWQTVGDAGNKILGKLVPTNNTVNFNTYLLPTFDARKTKLFLDVHYGSFTERYMVKIPDLADVSVSNSIIFLPNQAVNITGDYAKINIGFTITGTINLDDDAWDGIQ